MGDIALAKDAFRHIEFDIEPFIKQALQIKLDHDSVLCKPFATSGSCPLGTSCPLRHSSPASANFQPRPPVPAHAHGRTVCKHWLRGLCKKGNKCEFMHEYHLRKMPECWFFAKYGFCSSGDECMYLHVDASMRVRECPQYQRGFCPLGPMCTFKHIRRTCCMDYLAGFCERGPDCPEGHPSFDPQPPPPASSTRIPDVSGARFLPEASFRVHRRDWLEWAEDKNQRSGPPGSRPAFTGNKDLSKVLCYKCGQMGHFANQCPNPSVPGNRGGVERRPGQRD